MDKQTPLSIPILSKDSLVHLGSLDSFDITSGGKKAGRLILRYLKTGNRMALRHAISVYNRIIPTENFGGEYTALQWLCKLWLAPENAREELLSIPNVAGFYDLLHRDGDDNLRFYINYKYHFRNLSKDQVAEKARLRFLEDFILFCNPDRERWEKTRANIEKLNLKQGDHVVDLGSGSGYYTFKFADIIGEQGKVYAVETNPLHLDYLRDYIAKNSIRNVEPVVGAFDGIGLAPGTMVNCIFMCSLYHNVYSAFSDYERDQFVENIRNALLPGGKLIIVDNDLVEGKELPYHGPYINKKLIVSQMWYYGFNLLDTYQFTPQRYVLVFEMGDVPAQSVPEDHRTRQSDGAYWLAIRSASSVVRYRIIGTLTSGYSIRGKRVGKVMYDGFMNSDPAAIAQALEAFSALWPTERIGDDYTALMWFCQYELADEATRAAMRSGALADSYFHFFGDQGYERLKQYLLVKFDLERTEPEHGSLSLSYDYQGDSPIRTLNEWNEYLIFNNPNRVLWEKTTEMIDELGLREGDRIADIGCGGGYFSYEFSKRVKEKGLVYATEINKDALQYLESMIRDYAIGNIKPMVTRMNEAGLPAASVDVIFMCSMYHAVYITDIEFVKDQFIETLKKALKPGGRLVIVDNDIPEKGTPAYYGPGINPELIITQLYYYGFELEKRWSRIPQRFMLVFRLVDRERGKPTPKSSLKSGFRKLGQLFQKRQPKGPDMA
ncbi:MAG TPA: methyltransferase domain-containing protein [Candidatus Limiplasma sp.]|nr:methyltransferase domain-containing protein [Candidatus Limiplasma sp.]